MSSPISRRHFLKTAAFAAGTAVAGTGSAKAAEISDAD
ncbi:MAG: twin-arginine translocation signal domain-containing protein, partial [Desulfobacteraceae bacterium]|nr:twin-arginine translocation signal domain-containing protein [Desulfobacteraceae bacterium]